MCWIDSQFCKGNTFFQINVIAFLLSILSLTKFTFALISIVVIFLLIIYFIVIKRYLNIFLLVFSFVISTFLLWIIPGQNINAIFDYFNTGFSIASGYSEAMQTPSGSITSFLIFSFSILLFVFISLSYFLKVKKFRYAFILLISFILIIFAYRNGIIREDTYHTKFFYSQLVICFIVLIIALSFEFDGFSNKIIIFPFLLIIIIGIFGLPIGSNSFLPAKNLDLIRSRFSKDRYELIIQSKETIKKSYTLFESTKEIIQDHTINIMPWDISMLYAYDMNWMPNPIFQTYAIYTPYLDTLSYNFYKSNKAPEYILLNNISIDGRYPIFDSPKAFKAILSNYRFILIDHDNLLLERSSNGRFLEEKPIKEGVSELAEPLLIPESSNDYQFLYMDLELSLIGKVMNLFYRVPPLNIEFEYFSKKNDTYRFVRSLSEDGFLISCFIQDNEDMKNFLERKECNKPIQSVRILGNDMVYKKTFSYSLTSATN